MSDLPSISNILIDDITKLNTNDTSGLIPPIFHWIWFDFSRKTKEATLPSKYKSNIESWLRKNPTFSYHIWNEKEAEYIVKTYYPRYLPLLQQCPFRVQAVDAFRVILMHYIGGFYVDTDMECIRPIDTLRKENIVLVKSKYASQAGGILSNCFLGSRPNDPFWVDMLEDMRKLIPITKPVSYVSKYAAIMATTGPVQLTYTYRRKDPNCYVGNDKMFTVKLHESDPDAFCTHNGDNTWFNWNSEWKKMLVSAIILLLIVIFIVVIIIFLIRKCRKNKRPKKIHKRNNN